MRATTDFIVRSADNKPQLVVEVKTIKDAGPTWAASLRRNLFVHAQIPPARFFLLALPDRFYLWKDATRGVVPPQYELDAREVLSPYLKELPYTLEELTENSLELLVHDWLEDVINNHEQGGETEATAKLRQSGLYEAIKNGLIDAAVAE